MGTMRLELKGQEVEVEYRSVLGLFFVVYPELSAPKILKSRPAVEGFELVMAFENRHAACELAVHTRLGSPFFTMIPVVPYDTPYPRPHLVPFWLDCMA